MIIAVGVDPNDFDMKDDDPELAGIGGKSEWLTLDEESLDVD